MEQTQVATLSGASPVTNESGLCLLSLDGGGVRGLSTLFILKAIMDRLNNERKNNNLPRVKPCEIFNMIGGTSTGGLIAIMLGRLEMDVDECISAYNKMMESVFKDKAGILPFTGWGKVKAKFNSDKLREAIQEVIDSRSKDRGGSNIRSNDPFDDGKERGCKVFVCATTKETTDTVRLRSYSQFEEVEIPATICEAALATSAATGFFDSITINGRQFVDGAIGANNPIEELEGEASNIWSSAKRDLKSHVKCFISIGTGDPGTKAIYDNLIKLLSGTMVAVVTETEKTARKFIARWASEYEDKQYFRFNVDQGLQDVGLAEYKEAALIEAATERYLNHTERKTLLRDCVQNLSRKQNLHELEKAIGALYVTDSRLDRESLIRVKGLRTNGTCEWIRDNHTFKSWLGRSGLVSERRSANTGHEEEGTDNEGRVHNLKSSEPKSSDKQPESDQEETGSIHEDADLVFEDAVSNLEDTGSGSEDRTPDNRRAESDQQEFTLDDKEPASDFMWISGAPGKGKTMLSIFLTQELDAVKQASDGEADAIYFFCSNQYRSRNSAAAVLKSLISQIIWDHPTLVKHLMFSASMAPSRRGTAKTNIVSRGTPEKSYMNLESLDSLWLIFRNIVLDPEMPKLYCLIDGLDECDSESSIFLAKKFLEFSNTDHGPLKLTIVSRPDVSLLRKLPTIELNDEQVTNDIEKFISSKVDELSHVDGFNEKFRDDVRKELLQRSERTFLWIGFVMNDILLKKNCTEILDALEHLQPGLNPIYSRMLSRIDEQHHDRVSRILRWVTMAERSLTLEELAKVVGVQSRPQIPKEQAMRDYVALCGLFLEVRGQEVALVHKSAKDYLLREQPDDDLTLEKFRIGTEDAHYELARFCFGRVQNSHLQHPPPRVGYDAPSHGDSVLQYAILNWAYDAKESAGNADKLFHSESPFFKEKSILRQNWAGAYAHETGEKGFKLASLLHLAAYFGIVPWIDRLLPKGDKVCAKRLSEKDQEDRFPLHVATLRGHSQAVELMLERGAEVDTKMTRKQTPLMLAASNGHVDTIGVLLRYQANVDSSDADLFTPLMRAAFQGKIESVEALISEGANREAKDFWGQTALVQTSGWGKGDPESIVRVLLKARADPNSKDNLGNVALSESVTLRAQEEDLSNRLVELLLEHGADPNIGNLGGQTVLMYAALDGKIEILRRLLEHKAEPDTQDLVRETAMFKAANNNEKRCIELLLDHQASTELSDMMDDTPLTVAVSCGFKDVTELLLDRNASIEHQNKLGCTALIIAAYEGYEDTLRLLIDHGADVEARNGVGETALIGAIHQHEKEAVEMLLKAGADVDTRTANGNTALIKAARHGVKGIVELLLDHGADIHAQNHQMKDPAQTTAIHQAAWCGQKEIVKLLAERGADRDDNVGKAHLRGLYERSKTPFATDLDYEDNLRRRLWKAHVGIVVEQVGKIPFSELPIRSLGQEFFSKNKHPMRK